MTAYAYLPYLIRVAPPHRPRQLYRLNDVGQDHVDLLAKISDELKTIGDGFHHNEILAEGFRLKRNNPFGRSTLLWMRRGPVGNPGEAYDIDTGNEVETGLNTALLSELRGGFYIPEGSYFGFLFVERVGGRHLKDLIYKRVILPVAKALDVAIRVEAYAETDDWRKELAGQQVLRVTELLNMSATKEDASTLDEDLSVRVAAEGPVLSRMTGDVKDLLFDALDRRHAEYRLLAQVAPLESRRSIWGDVTRKGQQKKGWKAAPRAAFTVADSEELSAQLLELEALRGTSAPQELLEQLQALVPVDRSELESKRLEVSFGDTIPQKNFVVESDRLPQLVYPLQGRLTDIELQRLWEAQVEAFLGRLGVTLPDGWLLSS
ncbi:hypothetical protein RWH43_17260 [Microbacterium sp. KSW2-21]|uniref:Uncharacterized protein n=1 Tax=Microbacterium algihabitans TaxID=3075992 RepID=A0ABU3S048_9MICO|nr:hypothetical protein [Microbacterium sp. KSW2-21]MDU0328511.1 hypothetical protein [Microbacterium sp. KSW2-21]